MKSLAACSVSTATKHSNNVKNVFRQKSSRQLRSAGKKSPNLSKQSFRGCKVSWVQNLRNTKSFLCKLWSISKLRFSFHCTETVSWKGFEICNGRFETTVAPKLRKIFVESPVHLFVCLICCVLCFRETPQQSKCISDNSIQSEQR